MFLFRRIYSVRRYKPSPSSSLYPLATPSLLCIYLRSSNWATPVNISSSMKETLLKKICVQFCILERPINIWHFFHSRFEIVDFFIYIIDIAFDNIIMLCSFSKNGSLSCRIRWKSNWSDDGNISMNAWRDLLLKHLFSYFGYVTKNQNQNVWVMEPKPKCLWFLAVVWLLE